MPYTYTRICPICQKVGLQNIARHLRQAHKLSSGERKPYLESKLYQIKNGDNVRTNNSRRGLPDNVEVQPDKTSNTVNGKQKNKIACNTATKTLPPNIVTKTEVSCQPGTEKKQQDRWNAHSYTGFKFKHPFSIQVVGPTSCGKTHFVRQTLERPELKSFQVHWHYNQPQQEYDDYAYRRGNVRMVKGLPDCNVEDLHDLNKTGKNTVIVIDDLMEEAKDSKIVSKLFTQGRHRNVSVILILQNAFPKGKFNTEISRNAMYMVLFRSPADREQIKRVGQRMFSTQCEQFMNIYRKETEKPYGYILIDNKPETMAGHQVLSNIFGKTLRYGIGEDSNNIHIEDQNKLIQQSMEENADSIIEDDDVADDKGLSIIRDDSSLAGSFSRNKLNTSEPNLLKRFGQYSTISRMNTKKRKKEKTKKKKKERYLKLRHDKTSSLQQDARTIQPRAPTLRGSGFGGSGFGNRGIVLL